LIGLVGDELKSGPDDWLVEVVVPAETDRQVIDTDSVAGQFVGADCLFLNATNVPWFRNVEPKPAKQIVGPFRTLPGHLTRPRDATVECPDFCDEFDWYGCDAAMTLTTAE